MPFAERRIIASNVKLLCIAFEFMKPQTPFGQESSDIVKIYDEENKENSIPQKQENIQPDIDNKRMFCYNTCDN